MIEKVFNEILNYYTSSQFQDETLEAKEEFFDNTGVLDDNADEFDQKSSQFLDWYIFARLLSDKKMSPIMDARLNSHFPWSKEESLCVENLNSHRRSLFEFLRTKGDDVYLKDILENEKIIVQKSNVLFGFDRKHIFEARLVPSDGSYIFMRGFLFHPPEAKKFILKEVKSCRKKGFTFREPLMTRLQKMRYRLDRYKHVDVNRIYTND